MLSASGFRDGLGERDLQFDRESGEIRERLFLRPELSAYEAAVRRRVGRLASMADARLVAVQAVEHDRATGRLVVLSRHVSGTRLSDTLRFAHESEIIPDLTISLFVTAEILSAVHTFHSLSGLPHGALTPERVIVTAAGEILVTDYAFAEVMEAARFNSRRLWQEFGIADWLGAPYSFDADTRQGALLAVALMLGRPLQSSDLPEGMGALLAEVEEAAMIRGGRLFAEPVIGWLTRAFGAGTEGGFRGSGEAADACFALLTERERGTARPGLLQFLLELESAATPDVPVAEESEPEPAIVAEPGSAPVISEPELVPEFTTSELVLDSAEPAGSDRDEFKILPFVPIKRAAEPTPEYEPQPVSEAASEPSEYTAPDPEPLLGHEPQPGAVVTFAPEPVMQAETDAVDSVEGGPFEEPAAAPIVCAGAEPFAEPEPQQEAKPEASEYFASAAEPISEGEPALASEPTSEPEPQGEPEPDSEPAPEPITYVAEEPEPQSIEYAAAEPGGAPEWKPAPFTPPWSAPYVEPQPEPRAEAEPQPIAEVAAAPIAEVEEVEPEPIAELESGFEPVAQAAPAAHFEPVGLQELKHDSIVDAGDSGPRVVSPSPFALLKKRIFARSSPPPEPLSEGAPPDAPPVSAPEPPPPAFAPVPPPVTQPPPAASFSMPANRFEIPAAEPLSAPAVIRLRDHSTPKMQAPSTAARVDLSQRRATIFEQGEGEPKRPGFHIPWKLAAAAVVVLVTGLAATNMNWSNSGSVAPVASGTLVVETTPPGSEVFIDGTLKGVTPAVLHVSPGRHEMKLTRKGAEHSWFIDVASGARRVERLDWTALRQTGGIEVTSNTAGSRVLVDGKLVGETKALDGTPLAIGDLTPGRHTVVVQGPNGNVRRRVTVVAGETTKLDLAIYSGWVIVAAPIELQIHENGKPIATAGEGPVVLSAGPHTIELVNEALSYRSSHSIDITPGEEERLNVTPKGIVNLNAVPWAEVFIDGERIGETPLANVSVTLGARELLFKHPEHGERRLAVTVTGSTPQQISVDLTQPPSP